MARGEPLERSLTSHLVVAEKILWEDAVGVREDSQPRPPLLDVMAALMGK